jgi:hypothetical protein
LQWPIHGRAAGYFLDEIVSAIEFIAQDLNEPVTVGYMGKIILGKD